MRPTHYLMPDIGLNFGSLLLWAVFATGVLTLIMSISQQMGWSRISLLYMIGSAFTAHRGRAMFIGFGLHLIFGVVFALLYALVFERWGTASWWVGGLLGIYHGLFVLTVGMQLMPAMHPRMASQHHGPTPTRQLEPPGFLALNYGWATPLITLAGHIAYGVLLSFYQLSG